MEKFDDISSVLASRRRIRTHIEWNVDTHMAFARLPTSAATRSRISAAALLVNVIAMIFAGVHAALPEQVGDPAGQHPGLARSGARHHQQRATGVGDGFALGRVEVVEQIGLPAGSGLARGGLGGEIEEGVHRLSTLPRAGGLPRQA